MRRRLAVATKAEGAERSHESSHLVDECNATARPAAHLTVRARLPWKHVPRRADASYATVGPDGVGGDMMRYGRTRILVLLGWEEGGPADVVGDEAGGVEARKVEDSHRLRVQTLGAVLLQGRPRAVAGHTDVNAPSLLTVELSPRPWPVETHASSRWG